MNNELFYAVLLIILLLIYFNRSTTHHIYGEVAITPEEKAQGLMFRKHPLKKYEGMLFHMGYGNNSLWMKSTYIPLDIIFLSKDGKVIGYIEDTVPLSLKSLRINKPSTYVIEMNGNSVSSQKIRIGDTIVFHKQNKYKIEK